MMTRRQALKNGGLAATACAFGPALRNGLAQSAPATTTTGTGPFLIPAIPYAFDALEPHMDARTMEIHHHLHHAAYVTNLNKAVAQYPDVGKKVHRGLDQAPELSARSDSSLRPEPGRRASQPLALLADDEQEWRRGA